MEPLSITTGTIILAGTVLHAATLAKTAASQLRDAPQTIADVADEIQIVQAALAEEASSDSDNEASDGSLSRVPEEEAGEVENQIDLAIEPTIAPPMQPKPHRDLERLEFPRNAEMIKMSAFSSWGSYSLDYRSSGKSCADLDRHYKQHHNTEEYKKWIAYDWDCPVCSHREDDFYWDRSWPHLQEYHKEGIEKRGRFIDLGSRPDIEVVRASSCLSLGDPPSDLVIDTIATALDTERSLCNTYRVL